MTHITKTGTLRKTNTGEFVLVSNVTIKPGDKVLYTDNREFIKGEVRVVLLQEEYENSYGRELTDKYGPWCTLGAVLENSSNYRKIIGFQNQLDALVLEGIRTGRLREGQLADVTITTITDARPCTKLVTDTPRNRVLLLL